MSRYLILTGATGLLGQYLLRDLLLAGTLVAVLVRPRAGETAHARIGRVLGRWQNELGRALPMPAVLEGDVRAEGLGLSGEDHGWAARHCDRMLHCAASLTFRDGAPEREPWLTNLAGTSNVLDFCRQTGIRQLHHVSTAYVCGRATSPVFEPDLDRGQEFRNDYERSKFEAEKRVRAAGFLDAATIYRPAIIVGDSHSGYTSTYHGLYAYLHFAWVLRQQARLGPDGKWHVPVRVSLTGAEPRNLVPVDWVSAVISHLVLSPAAHGRTYHLTPTKPVTAGEIEAAMAEGFGYHGPTFVGPDGLAPVELNELERLFYDQVATYQPYWSEEPAFDCANTLAAAPHLACPALDGEVLRRFIAFAVADRWGKRRRSTRESTGR
jgi:nucleoside-diphosphate-sugar epimerase